MKYLLITFGFVLLFGGVGMVLNDVMRFGVPGALLAIAGAILLAGGSILDRIEKRS